MAPSDPPPRSSASEGKSTNVKKPWAWSRSKRLEQDLEHVNREIYRRNLELAQSNKTLALLQAIDSLVLNTDDPLGPLSSKLAQEVANAGYHFVGILGYGQDNAGDLSMLGWATPDDGTEPDKVIVGKLALRGDLKWLKNDDVLRFVNLDTLTDEQIGRYCKLSAQTAGAIRQTLKLRAVCCIKLRARQRLVGVMAIGFTGQPHAELSEFETGLFIRLSEAVGIAIDHKLLLEENERVVGELKQTNSRLRLLDRTKDDFISMASHQLRTPLTSVKGYVSMVLDGDGGKINEVQRKLLTQSFLSSQRMVYLISDLLNVSRLKTGKFIIEPVESDLSKMIEEEVEQLVETVKARGLELHYHKPEHFPILMIDETKLRQVIMNFIDNAIYYTPSGGHIDVYLVEKPESIEFTVVDDGIGVPKHEQHHLFSKFYRAKNAKSARPDGTGLGIFMAKKVIVAQGGAIIFKSQEGKGSTFGFTFPKAKLLPAPQKATAAPKKA